MPGEAHADVSRHFFQKEFVRADRSFAMHKINTFHWHLTDDQGWRVEIKKYPHLTQTSAWRANKEDVHWNIRTPQAPGEPATYGGFYTQDEIREVVRYAADRFITVVPEIEMPSHASAVLSAFPELSCTGGPFTVPPGGIWPIKDIYCGGNDSVIVFLENVLKEVVPLFPGPFIHIGGDEADKTEWKRCPKCQARIRAEGLADEMQLQSFFTRRIGFIFPIKAVDRMGRNHRGGLPPSTAVMSGANTGRPRQRAAGTMAGADLSLLYRLLSRRSGTGTNGNGAYIPGRKCTLEPTPDSRRRPKPGISSVHK
jgi:hexosaminidase